MQLQQRQALWPSKQECKKSQAFSESMIYCERYLCDIPKEALFHTEEGFLCQSLEQIDSILGESFFCTLLTSRTPVLFHSGFSFKSRESYNFTNTKSILESFERSKKEHQHPQLVQNETDMGIMDAMLCN